MADRPLFVVDTNVLFKWYVTERERNLRQARILLEDFLQSDVDLMAPSVLRYELSNLLRNAVAQGRLSADRALRAYANFEASGITFVHDEPLIQEALVLALAHSTSVFDTLFLLVGLRSNAAVVTDDERLASAGAAAGCVVVRLADYRSP